MSQVHLIHTTQEHVHAGVNIPIKVTGLHVYLKIVSTTNVFLKIFVNFRTDFFTELI